METADAETMTLEELRQIGALGPDFTPATERVWRLVRLRAKYILKGGKLCNLDDINKEIAGRRGV
jgi:hypothetical protein